MKAALIGCGRIGFLLESDPLRYKPCTHWGGARSAGIRINLACDINPERLDAFSAATGIPGASCYDSHLELLRKHSPEFVVIATWTPSHAPICIDAVKNGARVIVIEKPMAPDLSSARKMIRLCEKRGVSLIVNHERRYDPRYRKVKKIIDDGTIGKVRTVHASMLTGGYRGASDAAEGGGPLMHDGTHLVDMVRFLFGDIVRASGEFSREGRSSGFEDRAVAWMKTESGADVFLEAGGSRRYFVFELEISGTLGKIVVGNGYEALFMRRKSRLYTGFHDLAEAAFPGYGKGNCFSELYREAKKALSGRQKEISSSGADGYGAIEAIHAVYLSAHRNGAAVKLPVRPGDVDLGEIFGLTRSGAKKIL